MLLEFPTILFLNSIGISSGPNAAESQHAAQRRSTTNMIFIHRSKSASCTLSAPRLSQNSNFQRSSRSCLMRARKSNLAVTAQRRPALVMPSHWVTLSFSDRSEVATGQRRPATLVSLHCAASFSKRKGISDNPGAFNRDHFAQTLNCNFEPNNIDKYSLALTRLAPWALAFADRTPSNGRGRRPSPERALRVVGSTS